MYTKCLSMLYQKYEMFQWKWKWDPVFYGPAPLQRFLQLWDTLSFVVGPADLQGRRYFNNFQSPISYTLHDGLQQDSAAKK